MKIKNVGGSSKSGEARPARRAGAAAAGGFSDQVRAAQGADAAAPAAPVAGAAAAGGVEGILAAQDVGGGEDTARRQAREYGEHLLDYLETIRDGLLQGFVPMENLANLAQAMRQRRLTTQDSKLLEIIGEIELRAEVELAKLARGQSQAQGG